MRQQLYQQDYLSYYFSSAKEYNKAIEVLLTAYEIDPNDYIIIGNLAADYENIENYREAEKWYTIMSKMDSEEAKEYASIFSIPLTSVSDFKDWQPQNAFVLTIFPVIVRFKRFVATKEPCAEIPPGAVNISKFEQPEKTLLPTDVTESGMNNVLRFSQFEKAQPPMDVTELGITSDSNLLQPSNAKSPIDSTP